MTFNVKFVANKGLYILACSKVLSVCVASVDLFNIWGQ